MPALGNRYQCSKAGIKHCVEKTNYPAFNIIKKNHKRGTHMGIFDKLTGKSATLTPKSALVLSAITVIAADGVIDEAENQ